MAKNDFQNYFFKWMNNVAFLKAMENVRKSRDMELVTREEKEAIWFRNEIIIQQNFSLKIY